MSTSLSACISRHAMPPRNAGIDKRVTCHTLRHSFATAMLENGTTILMLQELMGHTDVKTTELYTHVLDKDISKFTGPLDGIALR